MITYSSFKLGRFAKASTVMVVNLLWPRFLRKENHITGQIKVCCQRAVKQIKLKSTWQSDQCQQLFLPFDKQSHLSALSRVCLKNTAVHQFSRPWRRLGSILLIQSVSLSWLTFQTLPTGHSSTAINLHFRANSTLNSWHLTHTEVYKKVIFPVIKHHYCQNHVCVFLCVSDTHQHLRLVLPTFYKSNSFLT